MKHNVRNEDYYYSQVSGEITEPSARYDAYTQVDLPIEEPPEEEEDEEETTQQKKDPRVVFVPVVLLPPDAPSSAQEGVHCGNRSHHSKSKRIESGGDVSFSETT